jgi:hypothetical protein
MISLPSRFIAHKNDNGVTLQQVTLVMEEVLAHSASPEARNIATPLLPPY